MVDLDVVAGQLDQLGPLGCHVVAVRAHEGVLALEAAPTDSNRPQRWRLHALAATLGESAGLARPPFYGKIEGRWSTCTTRGESMRSGSSMRLRLWSPWIRR
jgi:hypothetical protein